MERIFEDENFDDAYQKIINLTGGIISMREKERISEMFEIENSMIITVDFLKREIYAEFMEDNPQGYAIIKKQLTKSKRIIGDLNIGFIDIYN
jgi:hypothetical protein